MEQDKCQQCGTPTLLDAKFCEQCGAQLHAEVEPQPQSVPSPAPAPTYQTPSSVTETHYEGVPIRFVAILIDTIIIAIIAGILSIPFQSQLSGAVSLLIFLLYFIVLEGAYGQTVGKMAVKIKVVKEDGSKIDYADAVVRNVLRLIDLIPYSFRIARCHPNMDIRYEATAWRSRGAHSCRKSMRANPLLFLF